MSAATSSRSGRPSSAPDEQRRAPSPTAIASREEFAEALAALRRRRPDGSSGTRMTLQALASSAGLPLSTLHSYISGRSLPPVANLLALLDALGVHGDDRAAWTDALERMQLPLRQPRPDAGPRTMSSPVRDFVGRHDLLDQMTREWRRSEGRSPLLLLTGAGGIGKTSAALEWAFRRSDDFPDGALQVDLGGFGQREPMTPGRAQRQLLTALGHKVAELPTDPDELTLTYRRELATRQAVVLLDNARDAQSVASLLPHAPGVTTIVTSRGTLRQLQVQQGVGAIRVPLMDADEAAVLLDRAAGGGADARRVARLAESCAGLPLALRLSADALLGPEDDADLPRALRLMVQGRDLGVRGAVTSSLGVLDGEARDLFVRLGAIPGRWLESHAIEVVAGSLALDALDALAGINLLTIVGPSWHRHDLVGDVATELADADRRTPDLRLRLLRHYIAVVRSMLGSTGRLLEDLGVDVPHLASPDLVDADRVRDHEVDTMVSLMGWGLDEGHFLEVAALLDAVSYDARDRGGSEALQSTLHRLSDAEDAPDVARFTAQRILARACYDSGDPRGQVEWYERALDTVADRPDDDPVRLPVLPLLAVALQYEGRQQEAVDMLQRGARVAAASGSWLHHAICENNLASVVMRDNDWASSLEHTDAAVQSFDRAGAPELGVMPLCNAVRATTELDERHPDGGWLDRAETYLARLDAVVDPTTSSVQEQVASHFVHAEIALKRGRFDEAIGIAQAAEVLAEASGLTWATSMAAQIRSMVLQGVGQHAPAREAMERALATAEAIHDNVATLTTLLMLGEVALASGDRDEALRRLAQAREVSSRLGTRQDFPRIEALAEKVGATAPAVAVDVDADGAETDAAATPGHG